MKNLKFQLLILLLCTVCLTRAGYAQLTPSADSYTNTADPTTNYGAKTLLDVESASQTAYIRFDLSAIPANYSGANITKATLKLYVNSVTAAGSFNVDYVNGTWAENTITADLAPALGTTIAASVSLTPADKYQYILVDITPAVQAWLSGTANDGIALVGNSPVNATFDSKESTSTSHAAELDIVFAGGGGIAGITTANGSGLIGGGTSGTLNLSLTNTCAAKQVLQWSGSVWACASPSGSGTVTSVGSGAGLTGGPITGAGTLSLDTTKVPLLSAANTFAANQTINGTLTASSSGLTINATTSSTSDAAVGGTGNGYGVVGLGQSTSGVGVEGFELASTGTTYGVYGADASSAGYGVYGSSPYVGVGGNGTSYGVYGASTATGGDGVYGSSTGLDGVGIYGTSPFIGVQGYSSSTSGTTIGVLGSIASTDGLGVEGYSQWIGVEGYSTAYVGVYGSSAGGSIEGSGRGAAGVWGDTGGSNGYVGVLGTADANTAGYFANDGNYPTVYVENADATLGTEVFYAYEADVGTAAIIGNPGCNTGFLALSLGQGIMSGCTNYTLTGGINGHTYLNSKGGAVHLRVSNVDVLQASSGNVNISGNLSTTGAKNFRIDHPLDPANKYLLHAAIESSEVLNLYSGNVVLDASGEAVVQLPDWFEVINKDFRYQLTSIGAPGRDLYIAEEVSGGHFKIAGGKADSKVSWQVSGVRNDAWEKAHPMEVEVDKGADRGRYLSPELVGAPETARIGYMAPAPGSEQVVHHRPTMLKRGNASPSQQRTPPSIPIPPPMPVAPKLAPMPHPPAQVGKLGVNQK